MPTARELLDQVDALMRRNRNRDKDKRSGPATLTDALGARRDSVLAPTVILPDAGRSRATPIGPETIADADPISLETLADVPILTDVVDVWPGSDPGATPLASATPEPWPDRAAVEPALASAPSAEAIVDAATTQEAEATPVRAAALHDAPAASATPAPAIEDEFILEIPPAPAPVVEARPAEQNVVDAGVVIGEHDAQALADLHGESLGLDLLRMTFGHGEFAFEAEDLGGARGANDIPERSLTSGAGQADAGRSTVHIIGYVYAFRVSREGFDAARFGLREERHVLQTVFLQDGLHGLRAAAESYGVDGQDSDFGIHIIALVAGELVLAFHGLTENHPQRVACGNTVAAGQHEFVAEGMLRAANVPAQAAERGTC